MNGRQIIDRVEVNLKPINGQNINQTMLVNMIPVFAKKLSVPENKTGLLIDVTGNEAIYFVTSFYRDFGNDYMLNALNAGEIRRILGEDFEKLGLNIDQIKINIYKTIQNGKITEKITEDSKEEDYAFER